jgi:L-alanine-DL-glutamate epimerase-like enolase superfamily enzyme
VVRGERIAHQEDDACPVGNRTRVVEDERRRDGLRFQDLQKIAALGAERGIPFVPHGYSTDVIVAANLQLIAANRNAPLLEYCVEDSPLRWDLVQEDLTAEDGYVEIPDRPGLGITLNRETIEEYRVEF